MSTNVPIASITLQSATSSISFASIPQTYTDLSVVITGHLVDNDGSVPRYTFNGQNNLYSQTHLTGTGSTVKSTRFSNANVLYAGSNDIGWSSNSNNRSLNILNIMNYSNSTTFKPVISKISQTLGSFPGSEVSTGLYRSTSPISSIEFYAGGAATFAAGTTFDIYGINAANSGQAKATGGDSIYRDASYWYHIFRSSGTFTPKESLTADYLAVGGGAIGGNGGSSSTGAGGGGGGSSSSSFSLTANSAYTMTVGAGGTYGSFNGNSSTISGPGITTVTAGGGQVERAGRIGGLGGTGTSGNGGTGGNGAVGSGGGTNGQAGNAFSITGSSVTYGGGGGGAGFPGQNQGTGGAGGGGNAGNPAGNGVANTGGGGGGCSADNTNGGLGGSGIIIVRYPV